MEQIAHDSALRALYARFAQNWHRGIARLGYMQAYNDLVQADAARAGRPLGHVLDVGTGTGALVLAFLSTRPEVERVTLLDNSAEMLAEACANLTSVRPSVTPLEAGIGTNAVGPQTVDSLLCAHVIEHTPDAAACLAWFFGRLKPGGHLILSVSKPHWCTALVRWRWGHKAYRPKKVVEMLTQAGFRDIEIVPYRAGPPSRLSCGYLARVG